MRIYGSVRTCFWESADTQQLSDQGKLLAIYLLTGPHSNMIGSFRLPDGYIIEDLRWNVQTVKKAFNDLHKIKFLTRDECQGWLVVHHFLKWNPIQNPKQGVCVIKLFDVVPKQSTVFKPLLNALLTYGKYLDKEFVDRLYELEDGLDTLSEIHTADKEQNQDKDQDKDKIYMSGSITHTPDSQQSLRTQAVSVLEFLNEKTGRIYRPVDINIKLIIARLASGATVIDCRQVIAKKTREWIGDKKMAEYLRPATLFNATKFEQYLGELVEPEEQEGISESVS